MSKIKKQAIDDNASGEIKISRGQSTLAEFTSRPLPNDEEVRNFEDYVKDEAREDDIEEGLEEIYQDDNGHIVDVSRLDIKKKHGLIYNFLLFIFILTVFAGAGYGAYFVLIERPGSDATAIDFTLDGESEVVAGQEFFYTVSYRNTSRVPLLNVMIEISYPRRFIFIDSFPETGEKNTVFEIGRIAPYESGKIRIKGLMIGPESETGSALATLTYEPENFSSKFKKEAAFTTIINSIGINIDFDTVRTALVEETNEIDIVFNALDNNYLKNFKVSVEPVENIEILPFKKEDSKKENIANYDVLRPGVWQVNEVLSEKTVLPIRFIVRKKVNEKETLKFKFTQSNGNEDDSNILSFHEEAVEFNIMKSDLNLTLIINGSRTDQGVDFGETLNVSIVYTNKGDAAMEDVVIMAVLESDFLDWSTLEDKNQGREKGNTITWSKEEISELENVKENEEGTIDFSIKLMAIGAVEPDKKYEVSTYAQYSLGGQNGEQSNSDNRSNTIINKINSDLDLGETIRYFSDDNIPVGTGPHPPKVGETTEYKVYWSISNNLHELAGLTVRTKLPEYVEFADKNRATAGSIRYDAASGDVVWEVGRMPISVYQANGEFSIRIKPEEEDKNTIMVLLTGSNISATDQETEAVLSGNTRPKTTKLEDDQIAAGDGIVQ